MGYKTYTCPYARQCGGCEWLAVPYPIQLERKRDMLDGLFERFGIKCERIIGMDEPLHYRAKILSPFAPGKKGKPVCGMYARGTHDIVEISECLVEHKAGRPVLNSITELAQGFHIPAYNENTGRGLLRHAIVRVGTSNNKIMVTLVVNRKEFPRKKAFVQALRNRHPNIETVIFNVNTRHTNAVIGPLNMTAYGQGWLEDSACGCTFRIPADAFYQTNPSQMEVLYEQAVKMAQLQTGMSVLDAYCGIGTIGIIAAKQTKAQLTGVESVASAAAVATENARLNRIKHAEFIHGDAGEYLSSSQDTFDVVFMDPPRSGATEQFMKSLLGAAPEHIVYISCNPKTQARDIEMLGNEYRVSRLIGVDMFPHTKHVESTALLSRSQG